MADFSWIPFFREVHQKIHNENYSAQDLAKIANEIFGGIKDKDINGDILIEEMTPINFIGYFNRNVSHHNRIRFCNELKRIMDLNSKTPAGFDGIPPFNNQNCLCMTFKKDRASYIIDGQWEISRQILNNNIDSKLFNDILSNRYRYIGISYLSRFCFIVNPDKFYPFDTNMENYTGKKSPKSYNDYINYCENLKSMFPNKKVMNYLMKFLNILIKRCQI